MEADPVTSNNQGQPRLESSPKLKRGYVVSEWRDQGIGSKMTPTQTHSRARPTSMIRDWVRWISLSSMLCCVFPVGYLQVDPGASLAKALLAPAARASDRRLQVPMQACAGSWRPVGDHLALVGLVSRFFFRHCNFRPASLSVVSH